MQPRKNPAARASANRVPNIAATTTPLDTQEPSSPTLKIQSPSLAVRAVLKRFPVSVAHAQVICELSGLGGRY